MYSRAPDRPAILLPRVRMSEGVRRASAGTSQLVAHWRSWAPVAVLIALCLLVAAFNGNFLTLSNLLRLLNTAAIPLVLTMGATFIILMGSIDLSVEGVVGVDAVMVRLLVANDVSPSAIGLWSVPLPVLRARPRGLPD